jgi:hypothetical protein
LRQHGKETSTSWDLALWSVVASRIKKRSLFDNKAAFMDLANRSLIIDTDGFANTFILSRENGNEMLPGYVRSHACHQAENGFICIVSLAAI